MKKGILLLLIIFISPLSSISKSEKKYKFDQGFAVINGNVVYSLNSLEENVLVYCEPACTISKDGSVVLTANITGFGKLKQLQKISRIVNKMNSSKSAVESEIMKKKSPEMKKTENSTESEKKEKLVDSKDVKKTELKALKATFNLPYPKPSTIFIIESSGEIVIFPRKSCQGECIIELKDKSNHTIAQKEFSQGENPIVTLKVDRKKLGLYSWTFRVNNRTDLTGSFRVHHSSENVLGKALSQGNHVEVLQ